MEHFTKSYKTFEIKKNAYSKNAEQCFVFRNKVAVCITLQTSFPCMIRELPKDRLTRVCLYFVCVWVCLCVFGCVCEVDIIDIYLERALQMT